MLLVFDKHKDDPIQSMLLRRKDNSRKVKKDISWGKSIGLGSILEVTGPKEYKGR